MNIVVSINENYLSPLCVMLRSLLDANPETAVVLYLIHNSLREEHLDFLRDRLPDQRLTLQSVPVPPSFMADAPVLFHFPKEMYYRIFAAFLLPETVDRALYLDPDMVVNRSLTHLYQMELGEHYFAAAEAINRVSGREHCRRLDMDPQSRYFNSGVLLMNLAVLRREQEEALPLRYIEENRKRLLLPDQDVLNALYHHKTILLNPLVYNLDTRYYPYILAKSGGQKNLRWVKGHTAIIHYCGKEKPWKARYRNRMGVFYWQAAKAAGIPVPPTLDEDAAVWAEHLSGNKTGLFRGQKNHSLRNIPAATQEP